MEPLDMKLTKLPGLVFRVRVHVTNEFRVRVAVAFRTLTTVVLLREQMEPQELLLSIVTSRSGDENLGGC